MSVGIIPRKEIIEVTGGPVIVTDGFNSISVDDGDLSLTVDGEVVVRDGGESLTVDGTVAIAGTVPVSGVGQVSVPVTGNVTADINNVFGTVIVQNKGDTTSGDNRSRVMDEMNFILQQLASFQRLALNERHSADRQGFEIR